MIVINTIIQLPAPSFSLSGVTTFSNAQTQIANAKKDNCTSEGCNGVAKSSKTKSDVVDGTVSIAGGYSNGMNTELTDSNNSNNPSPTNQKTTISSLPSNNLNALTSKELKSFSKCIDTANELQGLSGAIVTGCLDTSKGLASTSTQETTTSPNISTDGNSNNPSPTNQKTTISSLP